MKNRKNLLKALPAAIAFCVMVCPVIASAQGDDTTNAAAESRRLVKKAMAYERAGKGVEAAKTYEELVRVDPSKKKVVSRRLVKLYAEAGSTNAALKWAKQVMADNPDPQAYLAGVYSMLGDYDKASEMLAKEVTNAKKANRKIVLRWQFADVREKQGNYDKAEALLNEAEKLAKGSIYEKGTQKRLERLKKNRAEAAKAASAAKKKASRSGKSSAVTGSVARAASPVR
jgi:tetratricopeptide (TPR) repeat protein